MENSWDPVVDTDEYNAVLLRAQGLADKSGWVLNPDKERVQKVIGLMAMNHSATGDYY